MKRINQVLLSSMLFFAFFATEEAIADEPLEVPHELILERFHIEKDCDSLVMPVSIDNKDHLFMVSTGSIRSYFDRSLPLGKLLGTELLTTANGRVEVSSFSSPRASVGKVPFQVDSPILAYDMESFRKASGLPIEGVLGMDFLGKHVLHIDFGRGEILLLKSTPKDDRARIPMYWQPDGAPKVRGIITGSPTIEFTINTGAASFISGYIDDNTIDALLGARGIEKLDSVSLETGSGRVLSPLYQGSLLAVGSFWVDRPVFGRATQSNILGYGFWSRFSSVTFDFSSRSVHLSKGDNYKRPEYWNISGIYLIQVDHKVIVRDVIPDSPGQRAGIRKGDVVLQIGLLRAGQASLHKLQGCLMHRGKVEFKILSDENEKSVNVNN
jgi:hypothetical protein